MASHHLFTEQCIGNGNSLSGIYVDSYSPRIEVTDRSVIGTLPKQYLWKSETSTGQDQKSTAYGSWKRCFTTTPKR